MNAPAVRYVTTPDGYSLAYAVSGAGLPLVQLSAPFSHVQLSWEHPTHQPILQALSERFLLVQYDSRGQGMSTRGLTPGLISVEHLCLDLETVIEKLGLEEFVLLGGGHVGHAGILYAARHPDKVKALVVTHCALVPEARPSSLFEAVPMENWDVFLYNILPRGLPASEREAGLQRLRQTISQADYMTHAAAIFHHDARPYLAQLKTPTLVIHARDFPHIPIEESMKLAASIPGARYILIPGDTLYGETTSIIAAIDDLLEALQGSPKTIQNAMRLSPRETEVLRLIAAGKSNQKIADELVLSLRTVERHITNLYGKIGAHGKADATAYALRHGFE